MGWIELFRPPEWPLWKWSERLIYVGGLACFLFLVARGAISLVRPVMPVF